MMIDARNNTKMFDTSNTSFFDTCTVAHVFHTAYVYGYASGLSDGLAGNMMSDANELAASALEDFIVDFDIDPNFKIPPKL